MTATIIDLSEWKEQQRVRVQGTFDPLWAYRMWLDFWFGGVK